MLYIFAIQLVSKRTLQGFTEKLNIKRMVVGGLSALAGLVLVLFILLKNQFISNAIANEEVPMKVIGTTLMGADKYQYVLPFEFISLFLLACIIGGIVISRKDK